MRFFGRIVIFLLIISLFVVGCSDTLAVNATTKTNHHNEESNPTPTTKPTPTPTPKPDPTLVWNDPVVPHGQPMPLPPPSPAVQKELNQLKQQLVYFSGPRTGKMVALTFDDGPDHNYTLQILDILKREHIHATFFCVGSMVRNSPDVLRRIYAEGHTVGNHSWNHPLMTQLSQSAVDFQLNATDQIIEQTIGVRPLLFRPPYGALTSSLKLHLHEEGYTIVNWSVDTRDWAGPSSDTILSTVKREIYPGGIILQHCLGGPQLKNSVAALPYIIDYLRQNGYQFVTIDQMFHIPAYAGISPQ